MKAYLQKLCTEADSALLAQHLLREYLQARILQSLQRAGAMQSLAFHGGTALRFLYEIPRYSEDLDFAMERAPELYNFREFLQQIDRDLSAEAYALDFRINEKRVVHKAFVRFRGLLHELGLSPHASEVFAIKLEIDTNPPAGAQLTTTAINRHVALNIQHHDPASLFAGKLHAVLQRVYPKGRDIYDLWWYLAQVWPEPNLEQLNAALAQSNWTGPLLTSDNWRAYVRQRIEQLDWTADVVGDVEKFTIGADWQQPFTQSSLLSLLD
jgi:predicted nucleotidyltransferase component of viral defense system